ncbi:hypothetical protein ABIE63_000768 [Limibacillus sp. MBR-115]|uniref:Uncharacterized protein n=1 Tax=Limibacillus halophilus TaxID=1579333 RepID=A0A839SMY0_9PROT|nr:hypothetical protein [Limibacillus halophilus]
MDVRLGFALMGFGRFLPVSLAGELSVSVPV